MRIIHLTDFQSQDRGPEHFSRLLHSGRLLQHFVVDAFACCELNDLNWIRQNQQQLRADCYKGLMDRINEGYELASIGSKASILPSSFTGGPRYMKAKKQDALALVRGFGKPTFFITFTCNPKWPEFERDLPPGISIKDRPDLTARVFQLKLKELLRDLTERHVLGQVKAHSYVIEFQKRGLPHAHILSINHPLDGITSANVDDAVQAEIPNEPAATDPEHQKRLYEYSLRYCENQYDPQELYNQSSMQRL